MKTKEQVEAEFRKELKALLRKWGASLEAEDEYDGYPECGEDIQMTVYIPPICDEDGNVIRPYTEISLGDKIGRFVTKKGDDHDI